MRTRWTDVKRSAARGLVGLLLGLLTAGAQMTCIAPPSPPSIWFDQVPPLGSFADLQGGTSGVRPFSPCVVVYIKVQDTWWVKPSEAEPLTAVGADGSWQVDITTGGRDEEAVEIRAYVVPTDYEPQLNTLPPDEVVLASATSTRQPAITIDNAGHIGAEAQLQGRVHDIEPESYRVTACIWVDGQWWFKPTLADPLTGITGDGSWGVDIGTAPTDSQATRVWAGIVRSDYAVTDEHALPAAAQVFASACLGRGAGDNDQTVDCYIEDMFAFIEDLLRSAGHDPTAGGLPAAFDTTGTEGLPEDFLVYADEHAMVYDAGIGLITMARLTPERRAPFIRQIADALSFAIENDPAGDGRIRDGYYANDIRAPEPDRERPSIRNGETHVGNAAWVIMALCTAHGATQDARYLAAAETLGGWVESHMRADDVLGGYYGGLLFPEGTVDYEDSALQRAEWRSVEHNTDLVSAFQSLASLTDDPVWQGRAEHARAFVASPSLRDCESGYWYLGTTTGLVINTEPLAEDTATWPWLAGLQPCPADAPLDWAWAELRTITNGFEGARLSDAGDGVVSEATAHLALALALAGDQDRADQLLESLRSMQQTAPNTDGRAIVAAPVAGVGVDGGLGARHYAVPHLASTAWTILAATRTNPFEPAASP